MALLLPLHFSFSLSHLLAHFSFCAQHHILNLLQVFFVLIELLFEGHRGLNLLLKIDLRLIDLLLSSLKLLRVVTVNGLKFLLLRIVRNVN